MEPENVIVQAVVRYFSSSRFRTRLSTIEEYSIQMGSDNRRADVVLIDDEKKLVAIIECKRSGYEGSGPDQLKSYLSATDTPLGAFANEIDPASWQYYENRGQNEFKPITRTQFEARILKRGIIKRFGHFVKSLFVRSRDPIPPDPPEPIPPLVEKPNQSRIIHIKGDQSLQNNDNTDFDPSLNGKPYYSEANGFYWAANHHGNPECVPQHVKHIISNEELYIKSTREQLQAEINELADKKNEWEAQKREYEQEIGQKSPELSQKREELAGLEVQLQAPTETELSPLGNTDDPQSAKQSKGSFVFQSIFPTFITLALIGLIFYLFVFYASVGDKAFSSGSGSVEQQLNEIVNHAALFQAWQAKNWFVLLIPTVFLMLAIVTHLSFEHRKLSILIIAVLVTLGLDSIIAIKISQRIHDDKVIRGLIEQSEKWTIWDINILAVLLLGFAVSLLLSCGFYYTLQLWRGVGSLRRQSKEQELREIKIADEKFQREVKIGTLKAEMETLQSDIDKISSNVETTSQKIDQCQAKIDELSELRNRRAINLYQMELRVNRFLNGWNRFVVNSDDGEMDVSAQINRIKQVAYETIHQYYDGSQEHSFQPTASS